MTLSSRLAVGTWLILLVVSAWLIIRTPVRTDLAALLPPSADRVQQLLMTQLRDGVVARLILIGLEGAESETLAEASRRIASHLQKSGQFEYVNNGESAYSAAEREILMKHRYLLSSAITAERFTTAGLREALQQDLEMLGSPAGAVFKSILPADPTGELAHILGQIASDGGPPSRHGVWFSADGRRAQLVAQTMAPGFDIDEQQRAVELIRSAATEAGVSTSGLLVSGPGVFAVESRGTIQEDSWKLSLIAAVLVTAILLLVYRSVRVVLLSMLPVASGLLIGIAVVGLVFGSVHGITLGFGATLIGEAVDYPTYLFTHIASGETVRETLVRILPTLRLAVLTTVFGGLTMLLSSFTGLSQLGVLTMSGTLVAGLVTRWVLPALAPSHIDVPKLPGDWTRVLRAKGRATVWIVGILLAAAFTGLAMRSGGLWDDDLANLSPVSESAKARDQQLRAELGAPDVRYLLAVTGTSQEDVLVGTESAATELRRLVEHDILGGFDSPSLYLPARATQERRRTALPEPTVLQVSLKNALQGLPFREGLFVPFLRDVEETRTGQPMVLADLQGSALGLKIRSLLLQDSSEWIALMPLRGVENGARLAAEAKPWTDSRIFLLDLKEESNRLVNGYRHESLRLTALGILAITLVLWWGLRDITKVVRVLSPVIVAVVLTVSLLAMLGQRLSLFHMVSLLLVIGIGLNYALFFNRDTSDETDARRTVLSLTVCSLATLCAFGTLAFSHTPVLHAIGLTVCLGCVNSFLLSGLLADRRGTL